MSRPYIPAALLFAGLAPAASADLIFLETFETDGNGTRYTTSVPEFSDGQGDFFTRTDGSTIGTFVEYQNQNGFFFAAMDIDGEVPSSQQTITFSGFDITGFDRFEFSGLFAEDDDGTNQDIDPSDFVRFEYQVDGGGFQNLLAFEGADFTGGTATNPANGVFRRDTDFDGEGDGAEVTDTFSQFSSEFFASGTTLDIRATLDLNSGDEDIAFDNLRLDGFQTAAVPEPGTFALLGLASLGGLAARRRKQRAA